MILIHRPAEATGPLGDSLDRSILRPGEPLPEDAVWIDLIEPTREEDRLVEAHLSIQIPTREEMADIEPSEILYHENNARYTVSIEAGKTFCGCKFFRENREFQTCKHIIHAREEAAWEADALARCEEAPIDRIAA